MRGDVAIEVALRPDHLIQAKVKPETGQALVQVGPVTLTGSAEDMSVAAAAFGWAVSQLETPMECVECGDMHPPRGCAAAELVEQQRLRAMAYHDSLTGLPNRRYLASIGAEMQVHVGPYGYLGALVIDMDGFKPVNDTYGHPGGDAVLREAAHRLQVIAGQVPDNNAAAARLGGDEFAMLLSGLNPDPAVARDQVVQFGWAVVHALRMPYAGIAMRISGTVGVALAPTTTELSVLLNQADRALIGAKHHGEALLVSPPPPATPTLAGAEG